MNINNELQKIGVLAREATRKLCYTSTEQKNNALYEMARGLRGNIEKIIEINQLDYADAKASGMSVAMLDRLLLSIDRINGMAKDIEIVAS